MSKDALVELRNIRKVFGSVTALDGVNFSVNKGEIHALLGENGAGKSTLMNILYGLYQPDNGDIFIEGQKVQIKSPNDSIRLGIGMVHQASTLVPEFTASENIILGTQGEKFILPVEREKAKIMALAENLGFPFPMETKVKELPAGVKQKIEIVRALYKGAKLLILDEPTTSLVQSEFEQLLETLKQLVAEGLTVIFIAHKMKEVMAACQGVTVLRKGRVQGSIAREEMSKEKLVKLMFLDKDIKITESALPKVELPAQIKGIKPACVLQNVSSIGGEENPGLKGVSFEVYPGEIFGVAAVSGNGEKELASCLTNPAKLTRGDIFINEKSINGLSTLDVFEQGVFYTPEDRITEGILTDGSITENILLGHHREKQFISNSFFVRWDEVKKETRRAISEYTISVPDEDTEIRRLSGGNIQRVIIARAFLNPISLLITHNPTSGLDISSVEFIFRKLVELRSKGGAIIWINEDLDELMILSDRIGVLCNGELRGIFTREEFDKYEIGLSMIGG